MKKIFAVLMLVIMLAGCTSATEFGACRGLGSDPRNPNLEYAWSYWNFFVGFLFSETVIVPVMVAVSSYECPVAKK